MQGSDQTHPLRHAQCSQVVKGYPNGTMSKHINELQVGDQLECKGPIPKMDYKPNMKKQIGMASPQPPSHTDALLVLAMYSSVREVHMAVLPKGTQLVGASYCARTMSRAVCR